MSENKRHYDDDYVHFWITYLWFCVFLLATGWVDIFIGLAIALALTTPLRNRWV